MITDHLRHLVRDALASLGRDVSPDDIVLEYPADMAHGDYATNVAMRIARPAAAVAGKNKTNPRALAEEIAEKMRERAGEDIARVEVAGPGFINITLSASYYAGMVRAACEAGGDWGRGAAFDGGRFLVEHSSPNLFKPLHIGHLVNNVIGESIVRTLRFSGAEVTTLSFPSDVSPGIAKAVWALIEKGWHRDLTIARIGEAYVYGTAQYDADASAQGEMDTINTALYKREHGEALEVYLAGRDLSLSYFKEMMARLGSTFDHIIFESEAEDVGKEMVRDNVPAVFQESDGAIIFKGSEHGLFDNVFINSAGFGTYLAKDLGLLKLKRERYDFDRSITVADIEQKPHFQLVAKAASLIEMGTSTSLGVHKSEFVHHGRLRFAGGEKISSRLGNVPLVEELLKTVKEEITTRFERTIQGSADENSLENENAKTEESASEKVLGSPSLRSARHFSYADSSVFAPSDTDVEKIAIGALKYAIARVSSGKNIIFDMERSLALEGDTGPYIQYTAVRAGAVLEKAPKTHLETGFLSGLPADHAPEEVARLLARFPETVALSAKHYDQHHIAHYLYELASAFNSWYAREQILDGSPREAYKLALTQAVRHTLTNGLSLIGIEVPERM